MESVTLEGKTVIVTGANTGIGKETALDLARRGAKVILACRNEDKANAAAQEIREKTENQNVIVSLLDLSSLASVRAFAERTLASEERLDILVNNAAMVCDKETTVDGLDLQFTSNYLGHFLLTVSLLDLLKKSAPSRVVNVSSEAHRSGKIDFEDMNREKKENAGQFSTYAMTKLGNVLFTNELQRRLKGTDVTTYSLHPGVVKTEIFRDVPGCFKCLIACFSCCMRTPTQGCQTTLYCALTPGIEEHAGKYFSNCAVKAPIAAALDEELAGRLWQVSEDLVENKIPEPSTETH